MSIRWLWWLGLTIALLIDFYDAVARSSDAVGLIVLLVALAAYEAGRSQRRWNSRPAPTTPKPNFNPPGQGPAIRTIMRDGTVHDFSADGRLIHP